MGTVDILAANPKLDRYEKPEGISTDAINHVNIEIVQHLVGNGDIFGLYTGNCVEALFQRVFDYLQDRLLLELRLYNTALLFRAYKERELVEASLTKNLLKVQWQRNESRERLIDQDYQTSVDLFKSVQALQILISMLIKTRPSGQRHVTLSEWRVIKALASLLVDVSVILDLLNYNLAEMSVTLTSDHLRLNDSKRGFSAEQYLRKESEIRILDMLGVDDDSEQGEVRSMNPATNIPELPPPLKTLSEAFIEDLGFSLEDFLGMLYVLGQIPESSEEGFPLILVREKHLLTFLRENVFPNRDGSTIATMFRFATIDFASYDHVENFIPSRLLRVKDRLALCPLVRITPEQLMFGNQMCLAAYNHWLSYMSRGEIPFSETGKPNIEKALGKLHKFLDEKHEQRVAAVSRRILGGDQVVDKIRNFRKVSPQLPSRPDCGEIDVLAVNNKSKTVFVLDAKNRSKKFRPVDVQRDLRDFFEGPKSHLAHLIKKSQFVQDNLPVFLSHFEISDAKGWKVKKAFVVPMNYAFSHDTRNDVDILLVEELEDYLLTP